MLRNIWLKNLRDRRLSLMWWSISLVALTAMTILFYPSIKNDAQINSLLTQSQSSDAIKAFAGPVDSLTSPVGYLDSQLYFLMIPLLLIIFIALAASRAIAGEEGSHTLTMLLSTPVSRRSVVMQKYLEIVISSLFLTFVFWIATVACAKGVGMEVSARSLLEATGLAYLLALSFGAVAFVLGAAFARRGLAFGIATALALFSYLINALAPLVHGLHSLQKLSLFYYYSNPTLISSHPSWKHVLALCLLPLVAAPLAITLFAKRDISVA